MKSSLQRSADHASNIRNLITSLKLLQDATESTTEPGPNGALLEVAIDRLEMIKASIISDFTLIRDFGLLLTHSGSCMFLRTDSDPSQALKTNYDIGGELAEKIAHQVSTMFHEMSRPTANEDIDRLIRKSVTRYTA
jgi:hypothetical protein